MPWSWQLPVLLWGGISGSGVADAAAIGAIMVPEMTKKKV
ncbi:MAG: TRAP transporter large permease subunit [[Clostridium] symbiosum]